MWDKRVGRWEKDEGLWDIVGRWERSVRHADESASIISVQQTCWCGSWRSVSSSLGTAKLRQILSGGTPEIRIFFYIFM